MAGGNTSTEIPQAGTFDQHTADRVASTIDERIDDLPGGRKVKEFAQAAADRFSSGADYVRSHDARRMMTDVETAVRNHPGLALLIAAALGFMVGRTLVRD
jgi:hypothetical protein